MAVLGHHTHVFTSECDNLRLSTKFGIQPTISQFKIVQNVFERCHLKAHFPCFRMLY